MKRLSSLCVVVFAALVLVACGSDGTTPDPLEYQAHITGQIGPYAVDVVVVLEPTGTLPEATIPASPAPSLTPTATVTPLPTNTPRPTVIAPTPTREVTAIPTVAQTSIPNPTETPEPVTSCHGLVTADPTLNVRATPGGTVIGTVRKGDTLTLEARQVVGTVTWYQIAESVSVRGWVSGAWLALSGDCAFPVARVPAFGFHAVPGANRDEMIAAFRILQAAGITPVVKAVNEPELTRQADAMGALTIYRSVHPSDCPNVKNPNPIDEARRYTAALNVFYNQNIRPDFFEPVNECNFDDPAWWNSFGLELLKQADALGWGRVVFPTFNPGRPELNQLPALLPLLRQMDRRGDCLGMHAYGVTPGVWVSTSGAWLGYRHRLIHDELVRLDPALADLCIALTEVAAGAGNDPVTIADVVAFWRDVRKDSYIVAVAWWTAGNTSAWPAADLNGRMIELATAIN